MKKMKQKYLVDEDGTPTAVLLDIKSYRRLVDRLEELEEAVELDEAVRAAKSFRPYSEIRAELRKAGRL